MKGLLPIGTQGTRNRHTHAEDLVRWVEEQLGYPVSNRADAVRRLAAIGDDAMRAQLGELLVYAERNEPRGRRAAE